MRGFSLRAKVFVLFAVAALLIVVPTLLLIAQAVERKVYEDATRELVRADSALQNTWALRGDALESDAQLAALDPEAVQLWAGGRFDALERTLREKLSKEAVAAVDTAGERLLGAGLPPGVLQRLAATGETGIVLPDTGPPLRVAAAMVILNDSVPVPLGIVGVATKLSAVGFRTETPSAAEVALTVGDSVIGATFPDSLLDDVRATDLAAAAGRTGAGRETIGGQPYLVWASPLQSARGPRATVILFRPIAEELRLSTGIKQSLFGIGFLGLVLALVLAAFVARIVARPAQALALASQRLARGDYEAPLPRAANDEIGQLARAFGEMRTAIAEREQRLRSAQAEMIHREKLAAMGRLVAQLSHEINNPIYNIQNCLEALERRGDPADPNREFLTLAQEELLRMAALTRQLLDQSRPLSDHAAPTDLNALVRRVLTLAGTELAGRGVRVQTALDATLPRVTVHPEAIQQVLANLVTNAGDAMPGGGTVRVETRADADAVEVVVEDTGTGISDEALPHIFEAFYTTKPGVTGLGLGLFVSEGIVRGHRGRITVESRPGQGSRFTVRLPRETLDEALSAGEPEHEAAIAAD